MTATASRRRVGAVSLRRFVNDNAVEVAAQLDDARVELFEVICERGDLGCDAGVKTTPAEFQAAPAGSIVAHT